MTASTSRTVACLGPEGSFSHEFACSRFPGAISRTSADDFEGVIRLVESGAADIAVLPFLNSNGVDVRPAQAAIAKACDWICIEGCFPHKIVHNVVVAEGFKRLKKLVSKEQVFPQCTNWLDQWDGIETAPASSTSAALAELLRATKAERESTAVICNQLAVSLYGGEVRWAGVQNPGNTTLFLVASRRQTIASEEQALICLTCPSEKCYEDTINDFSRAGMPLKFTSLKGEFTSELPCFLQFEVAGRASDVRKLTEQPYRSLVGAFSEEHSLAACVGAFFDDIY